jgi:hypothetical protein
MEKLDPARRQLASPTTKPPRIWWGLIGVLAGIVVAHFTARQWNPEGGNWLGQELELPRVNALWTLYCTIIGAAIGIAFEIFRDRADGIPSLRSFGIKALLLVCYVIAVMVFTVNGLLTLHTM